MSLSQELCNSKGSLAVRLTSSRTVAPLVGNGDVLPRSSGLDDQSCFGDEWFDDDEEEANLHQMMDALENPPAHLQGHSGNAGSNDLEQNAVEGETSSSCSKPLETLKRDSCLSNSVLESKQNGEISISSSEAEKEVGTNQCSLSVSMVRQEQSTTSETLKPDDDTGKNKSEIRSSKTPLQKFKEGYLWVSDLTAQAWCERQLLYDITFEGPLELLETKAMKVGSEMHLERELEVHVIKEIAIKTMEDKWAVKFLNIMSSISRLLQGGGGGGGGGEEGDKGEASRCVIREMPIFGHPFQSGAFVVGVIDEIRYNAKGQLELVEFKTRARARSIPSESQRKIHKLQVMLYKQLFDEAVGGQLSKQTILDSMRLDPEATVNDEIATYALGLGLGLELTKFGDYLDAALDRFQFLPKIENLMVEYSSQDDKAPFAVDDFPFDPVWLKDRLDFYNAYWEGRREVEGVDVEDAWKCNYCNYVDECDWRKKMHEKLVNKNTIKRVKIEVTQ